MKTKKQFGIYMICIAFLLSITGKANDPTTRDTTPYTKVGVLALEGKQIIAAHAMFEKAIQVQKTSKAYFFHAITTLMMAFQGFPKRFLPMASPKQKRVLLRLMEKVKRLGTISDLKIFLLALPRNTSPIRTYSQLQGFLTNTMLKAVQIALRDLKQIRNSFQVRINLSAFGLKNYGKVDENKVNCHYQVNSGWQCKIIGLSGRTRLSKDQSLISKTPFEIDHWDVKILKGALMAIRESISVAVSYQLNGLENLVQKAKRLVRIAHRMHQSIRTQNIIELIRKYPDLGRFSANYPLPTAPHLEKTIDHFMDIETVQNQICGNISRMGDTNLIQSFCVGTDVFSKLETMRRFLQGTQRVVLGTDDQNRSVVIKMDVRALLRNQPQDLKVLLPKHFNSQGEPTDLGDPTLAGLFPDGDLVSKLKRLHQWGPWHLEHPARILRTLKNKIQKNAPIRIKISH